MSVFVLRLIEANRRGLADVATLGGTTFDRLLFGVSTSSVNGLGFAAQHTPNDETPIGDTHASITPPLGLSKAAFRALRTDLAVAMHCFYGSPTLAAPPGA